ncbi:hypothetical protein AB0C52_18655 [Streptomyces sp. NPDC048717]|uniref:DUF7848 domain-containing protein n=1 Tax=Streptomyces sp. NPDC048717 TaxID=3154928 RepID=UPI003431E470
MSGPKTIIKPMLWSLIPDREPDAEPMTHAIRCAVCGDGSEGGGSWEAPQIWALEHSGRNPSHHTYREIVERPWRTIMHG